MSDSVADMVVSVDLVLNTQQIEREVAATKAAMEKKLGAAGKSIGKSVGGDIGKGVNREVSRELSNAKTVTSQSAQSAGREIGRKLGVAASGEVTKHLRNSVQGASKQLQTEVNRLRGIAVRTSYTASGLGKIGALAGMAAAPVSAFVAASSASFLRSKTPEAAAFKSAISEVNKGMASAGGKILTEVKIIGGDTALELMNKLGKSLQKLDTKQLQHIVDLMKVLLVTTSAIKIVQPITGIASNLMNYKAAQMIQKGAGGGLSNLASSALGAAAGGTGATIGARIFAKRRIPNLAENSRLAKLAVENKLPGPDLALQANLEQAIASFRAGTLKPAAPIHRTSVSSRVAVPAPISTLASMFKAAPKGFTGSGLLGASGAALGVGAGLIAAALIRAILENLKGSKFTPLFKSGDANASYASGLGSVISDALRRSMGDKRSEYSTNDRYNVYAKPTAARTTSDYERRLNVAQLTGKAGALTNVGGIFSVVDDLKGRFARLSAAAAGGSESAAEQLGKLSEALKSARVIAEQEQQRRDRLRSVSATDVFDRERSKLVGSGRDYNEKLIRKQGSASAFIAEMSRADAESAGRSSRLALGDRAQSAMQALIKSLGGGEGSKLTQADLSKRFRAASRMGKVETGTLNLGTGAADVQKVVAQALNDADRKSIETQQAIKQYNSEMAAIQKTAFELEKAQIEQRIAWRNEDTAARRSMELDIKAMRESITGEASGSPTP